MLARVVACQQKTNSWGAVTDLGNDGPNSHSACACPPYPHTSTHHAPLPELPLATRPSRVAPYFLLCRSTPDAQCASPQRPQPTAPTSYQVIPAHLLAFPRRCGMCFMLRASCCSVPLAHSTAVTHPPAHSARVPQSDHNRRRDRQRVQSQQWQRRCTVEGRRQRRNERTNEATKERRKERTATEQTNEGTNERRRNDERTMTTTMTTTKEGSNERRNEGMTVSA